MENNEQDLPEVPETPNNSAPVNDSNYHYEDKITLSQDLRDNLLETAKWGKLLAIVGYVGLALMLLASVFMILGFSLIDMPNNEINNKFGNGIMIFMGLIYAGFAALHYFPISYLYKFSEKVKFATKVADQMSFEEAFSNLKSLFKFSGIVTIVLLSIYGLIFLFFTLTAVFLKSL